MDVFVIGDFAFHRRNVVRVPIHQTLADLRLLIDFWKGHFTFNPTLSYHILLDFLLSEDVTTHMPRHIVQSALARLFFLAGLADIVAEILLFDIETAQLGIRRHLFEVGLELLLGDVVEVVV